LEKVAVYENTMETCAFFHEELKFCTVQHSNVEKKEPLAATPEGLRKTESILKKQMAQYGKRFRSFCETSQAEADENIRLADSFRCIANAIESERRGSDGNPSSLSMLNQGHETNAVIKDLIVSFAGVPSEGDIADWRELRSLLPR
jgi:hypothetical protein